MAILRRSRVLCWLKPPACLLSCDSGRVTGQLKPLMYYSSTHVRYYRGTGGQGDVGRGRHALLHHGVRKWTQTHWQVSRLATREAHRQGSVPHDASVTVSSKTLPSSSTNIPSVSLLSLSVQTSRPAANFTQRSIKTSSNPQVIVTGADPDICDIRYLLLHI